MNTYEDKEIEVGGKRELLEVGTYPARVNGVIDLGTAKTRWFKTDPKTKENILDDNGQPIPVFSREFSINFEVYDGDKVNYVSAKKGFSLGEDSFYGKMLKAFGKYPEKGSRVRASTLTKSIIGEPCMVSIFHNESKGTMYANVGDVITPMKGMPVPPLVNKGRELFFDNFAEDVFKALPEFLRTRIEASDEYKQMRVPDTSVSGGLSDYSPTTWTDENGQEQTTAF